MTGAGEREGAAAALARARDQFDVGDYWRCHETLEPLWLAERSPDRAALQGVIQLAAGLLKWREAAYRPAERLLEAAVAKLRGATARPPHLAALGGPWELDWVRLHREAADCLVAVRAGRPAEAVEPPRLHPPDAG